MGAGVATVAVPCAVLAARPDGLTAPNPVLMWWAGAAVAAGAAGAVLLPRFAPPRGGRAWRMPLVAALTLLGCYTAAFPAALVLLFFAPQAMAVWLAVMAFGAAGAVRLWSGRAVGGVLAAAPPLVLGVLGVTVPPTAAHGHGYPTLGGWTGLAAGITLLLLTEGARRVATAGPHQPHGR